MLSPQQRESVELDAAHTTAGHSPSPDSRTGGDAAFSLSAQTAPDSAGNPRTAADSKQHAAGDPQQRWQAEQSARVSQLSAQQHTPAGTLSSRDAAYRIQQQGSQAAESRLADAQLQAAHEVSGYGRVKAATGRQLLADAASQPPFTVSPAQSGVCIDSPELRMNGAPTQLFQIDFGGATKELNPINLFTVNGAVECAPLIHSS